MKATTPEKAFLSVLWQLHREGASEAPVEMVIERVGGHHDGARLSDDAERNLRFLTELGLLSVSGENGTKRMRLTQVGALLASRLEMPEPLEVRLDLGDGSIG